MTKQINEATDTIIAAYTCWKRNRDMIAGEDAVKAAGDAYLPRQSDQDSTEFNNYVKRTPFFPGSSRAHDGLLGLVTRKKGQLEAPKALEDIFNTITRNGNTVDDLAEDVVSEILKVGYHGLLVDHPDASPDIVSAKQAEDAFVRPFIAPYQAEAILEVTPGIWGNRQMIVRVRLLDDEKTVRELRLDGGIYTVTMHRQIGSQWIADEPFTPTRGGQPLTEIPFVVVTQKAKAFAPIKGPMDDICALNVHCYVAQAEAKNSRYWSSAPMFYVLGAEIKPGTVVNPGKTLNFAVNNRDNPVELGYVEFSGAGQKTLEDAVKDIQADMAKLGSNILANEKVAAEAAETLAIRRSSENSVLASMARTVGRQIEKALKWVAWWQGQDETKVVFKLNTDFVPSTMTPEEQAQNLAAYMAGGISWDTFIGRMIDGELLPDGFDIEAERQRIAADSAAVDRPQTTEEAPDQPAA